MLVGLETSINGPSLLLDLRERVVASGAVVSQAEHTNYFANAGYSSKRNGRALDAILACWGTQSCLL
jgi:hypothetical protein